jgi:hypothetical protein
METTPIKGSGLERPNPYFNRAQPPPLQRIQSKRLRGVGRMLPSLGPARSLPQGIGPAFFCTKDRQNAPAVL